MFNFQNFLNNKINNIKSYFVKKVEDWDENFFQNRTAEEKERYKVSKKRNRTINTEIGFATFKKIEIHQFIVLAVHFYPLILYVYNIRLVP